MSQAFEVAERLIGAVKEVPGPQSNPFIVWALTLCGMQPTVADEVPWCSAFMNACCFLAGLPRSKSAAARSWLAVGTPVDAEFAAVGDVVILKRGEGVQPGPEVTAAPGHVGFVHGFTPDGRVMVLAGNQGNAVSVASAPLTSVLGFRRLT